MMRKIFYIGILLIASNVLIHAQVPEQVKSITKIYHTREWYLKQAELWKKEIEMNSKSENAWYNYFMANRMSQFGFDNKGNSEIQYYNQNSYLMNPDSLVAKAHKAIPNTFVCNYITWRNTGASPENFKYLEKAYSLNPDFEGINEELVVYYETQVNREKRQEYNLKWFKQNEYSPSLLTYNYNVLMSVKPNGVLLIFGDNNTFPIWMLQDVLAIREDVKAINVSLLSIDSYRKNVFLELGITPIDSSATNFIGEQQIVEHIMKNLPANRSLFVGLGSWKEFDKYPNMYLEGLVLEYSKENIDNIAALQNNFENKYQLDYITHRFQYEESPEIVNQMSVGYLAGIFKLYDHYKKSGDLTNAQKMQDLGMAIGKTGSKELLNWVIESLK